METVQQNGRFTLFSSKFHSMYNLFSLATAYYIYTNHIAFLAFTFYVYKMLTNKLNMFIFLFYKVFSNWFKSSRINKDVL